MTDKDYCCDVFKKMIDDEEILFDWPSGFKLGYFDSYNDYPINYCPNCGTKLVKNKDLN